MGVYGLGHDVVDVASFGEQLAEPGSRMRALFSVREVRQAAARAARKNDGEAVHLAAKWAGKEAFLKAWCEALGEADYPFTLDDFPWSGVEILDDSRGVPHVTLSGKVAEAFRTSMEEVLGDADGAHAGGAGGVGVGARSAGNGYGGGAAGGASAVGGGYGGGGYGGGAAGGYGPGSDMSPYAMMRNARPVDPSLGPHAVMRGAAGATARGGLSAGPSGGIPLPARIHVSLSHDGPVASAVVIIGGR